MLCNVALHRRFRTVGRWRWDGGCGLAWLRYGRTCSYTNAADCFESLKRAARSKMNQTDPSRTRAAGISRSRSGDAYCTAPDPGSSLVAWYLSDPSLLVSVEQTARVKCS